MKSSELLYGRYYDREFVQENLSIHYRKILWAQNLIDELQEEPIEKRDFQRINECIKAIKFNESLIAEAFDR